MDVGRDTSRGVVANIGAAFSTHRKPSGKNRAVGSRTPSVGLPVGGGHRIHRAPSVVPDEAQRFSEGPSSTLSFGDSGPEFHATPIVRSVAQKDPFRDRLSSGRERPKPPQCLRLLLGHLDEFQSLNICPRHVRCLRPVAAKHDRHAPLGIIAGGIVVAADLLARRHIERIVEGERR